MLIANIQNPVPMDYREAFPNTSFSVNGPGDEFLSEQGYAKVNVFIPHDRRTQKLIPAEPYLQDGWIYTVVVADKTADELQAEADSEAAKVRVQRNALLSACDWTQVADAPVDSLAWAVYRQKLRELPEQEGFPWVVKWPEKPN